MSFATWSIALIVLLIVAGAIVVLFRHGARQRFVLAIPFGSLALFTFGVQMISYVLDWLAGDTNGSLLDRLVATATVFAACSIIWLAGFFFGRWRASRREGILRVPR